MLDETLRHPVAEDAKGVLDVINRAGAEAFKIAVGAIPMLVLALVAIMRPRPVNQAPVVNVTMPQSQAPVYGWGPPGTDTPGRRHRLGSDQESGSLHP